MVGTHSFNFISDFLNAGGYKLGFVVFIGPDTPDQVMKILLEHSKKTTQLQPH